MKAHKAAGKNNIAPKPASDFRKQGIKQRKNNFKVRISAPSLQEKYLLCLTGSAKAAGCFDAARPLFFKTRKKAQMKLAFHLEKKELPFEFKIAVFDTELQTVTEYEPGANRLVKTDSEESEFAQELNVDFLQKYCWRGAGVNVPLFSLRSHRSAGIGDLRDLKAFGRLAAEAGLKLIQLLPINDTTASYTSADSYPYSAISAFAIDPKYIDIDTVISETNTALLPAEQETIARLNKSPVLLHAEVVRLKQAVLYRCFSRAKSTIASDKKYAKFFKKNCEWLLPYAGFCYLRDDFKTADFTQWFSYYPYSADAVNELNAANPAAAEKILFHCFIQFHLHRQLKKAARSLRKAGIMLKADLPIGVGRFSADTWQFPELFHMNMQAGAPPDAFSSCGQNWGFPTYNFPAHAANNFSWFRRRLQHLEKYFGAVRIDHVLGFFRIWSIPLATKDGRVGTFVPASGFVPQDFANAGIEFFESSFTVSDNEDETNVILLKKDGEFHFRINMHETELYKKQAPQLQAVLTQMHNEYFFYRQNSLWKTAGEDKLAFLKSATKMLVCAEDLGMVPPFTAEVLHKLGILSLRVLQMPHEDHLLYSDPARAPYLSVVTPATHDMPPMRLWWELQRNEASSFYRNSLHESGDAHYFCEPWVCEKIIAAHLHSPAMWSIFLLQDLLGIDGDLRRESPAEERINDPADGSQIWNYRMHLNIEELRGQEGFIKKVRNLITSSGR